MVFESETIRKTTYLVAGILPATFFGLLSLVLIATPLIFWTAAAWVGITGLILALINRPYDAMYATTTLMLICGVAAMAPVTTYIFLNAPFPIERGEDYIFTLVLLSTVSPIGVALHFLYFQASRLMASWRLD